ncbi:MAG: DNA starvation/stationary phase protection protein, partial [Bacteroidota bacterium]
MKNIPFHPIKAEETLNKLDQLLINYHIHYQKLRAFHWNVYGPNFFELHRRFEEMYNEVKVQIDEIAERILTLGSRPSSTLKVYLEKAQIRETHDRPTPDEMVAEILGDLDIIVNLMRETLTSAADEGDEGTLDIVSNYLKKNEKHRWMLSAY